MCVCVIRISLSDLVHFKVCTCENFSVPFYAHPEWRHPSSVPQVCAVVCKDPHDVIFSAFTHSNYYIHVLMLFWIGR